jgi:hypothetical protein
MAQLIAGLLDSVRIVLLLDSGGTETLGKFATEILGPWGQKDVVFGASGFLAGGVLPR